MQRAWSPPHCSPPKSTSHYQLPTARTVPTVRPVLDTPRTGIDSSCHPTTCSTVIPTNWDVLSFQHYNLLCNPTERTIFKALVSRINASSSLCIRTTFKICQSSWTHTSTTRRTWRTSTLPRASAVPFSFSARTYTAHHGTRNSAERGQATLFPRCSKSWPR